MRVKTSHIWAILFGGVLLSGCSSVKMPKLDGLKLSEFRDAAKKINSDFPDVADAPAVPTDVPNAAVWDRSAERMIRIRDGFEVPGGDAEPKTPAEVDAEYEALKNKVRAYREDDPADMTYGGGLE